MGASQAAKGWLTSYDTLVSGRNVVSSWVKYKGEKPDASMSSSDPHREFSGWICGEDAKVVDTRFVWHLVTSGDLRPLSFCGTTSSGTYSIAFDEGDFKAQLQDGTSVEGSLGGAKYALPSNSVPLLGLFLAENSAFETEDGTTTKLNLFSPESLCFFEYSLKKIGSGEWLSHLGERLFFASGDKFVSGSIPDKNVEYRSVNRPYPRWKYPQLGRSNDPRESAPNSKTSQYRSQGVCQVDVKIDTKVGEVVGNWTRPADTSDELASVLLIGGSGKHDRFGNAGAVTLGYEDLIERLSSSGISCLSYDKRGAGNTTLGEETALNPSFNAEVEAAEAALRKLQELSQKKEAPIFIIGHSLGGLVALDISARCTTVGGLVLLATAADSLDVIVLEQVAARQLDMGFSREDVEHNIEEQKEFFKLIAEHRPNKHYEPDNKFIALRRSFDWWHETLQRKPIELIQQISCPVLILQGDQDIQVAPENANRLFEATRDSHINAKLVLQPNHDHLFHRVTRDVGIASYTDKRRKFSRITASELIRWIREISDNHKQSDSS